jgi:hypothetical protein
MDRAVVANIELERRERITVDEVYAFALALNTSPTTLLIDNSDAAALQRIGDLEEPGAALRSWWRGEPLDNENVPGFYEKADRDDWFLFQTNKAPGVEQAEFVARMFRSFALSDASQRADALDGLDEAISDLADTVQRLRIDHKRKAN